MNNDINDPMSDYYEDAPEGHILTTDDWICYGGGQWDQIRGLAGDKVWKEEVSKYRRPKQIKTDKIELENWEKYSTQQRAKYNLPVLQAMTEGQIIEFFDGRSWHNDSSPSVIDYPLRVKPKPQEPRRVWVVYRDDTIYDIYDSKQRADDHCSSWGKYTVVEFVEAITDQTI